MKPTDSAAQNGRRNSMQRDVGSNKQGEYNTTGNPLDQTVTMMVAPSTMTMQPELMFLGPDNILYTQQVIGPPQQPQSFTMVPTMVMPPGGQPGYMMSPAPPMYGQAYAPTMYPQ